MDLLSGKQGPVIPCPFGVYCVQMANFSKSLETPESVYCPKHSSSGLRWFPSRWLAQITRGQQQVFSSNGESSSYSVAQNQAAAESEGAVSVALCPTAARLRGCPPWGEVRNVCSHHAWSITTLRTLVKCSYKVFLPRQFHRKQHTCFLALVSCL